MVPSAFVMLEALPLTPNGKIDRRALPAPNSDRPALDELFVAPRTPLEHELAQMWSIVLGMAEIGVNDNFFELGGDSLRTTQLIFQVEKNYQVVVPLMEFFQIPTIAGLASLLQRIHSDSTTHTEFMSLNQLQQEADLDLVIDCSNTPVSRLSQSIFLTGATGFIGSFLLKELLHQTAATIYCLVRAETITAAKQKLARVLKQANANLAECAERIVLILGDLAQPSLGLTDAQFQELADSIEVIYHSGANVHLLYPYTALRSTNVLGTREILRLASTGKTKPVHYLSTLDVLESIATTGKTVIYETDSISQGKGIAGGYAQSKWIAECLMSQAAVRGIPVCIYRPGTVTGHSKTGHFNPQDWLCLLMKSFIQLGCAPDLNLTIDVTPVDYISQAIAHLSLQTESYDKTFHLINPQSLSLRQLVEELNQLGYLVQTVPHSQWQAALKLESNALQALAPVIVEPISDHCTRLELWLAGNQVFDCRNTMEGLKDFSRSCPKIDAQLLSVYIDRFIQDGFLITPAVAQLRH
ncbi:thioester reductase domain-containing protein [Leptolyngbya sp. AN10]